LKDPLVYAIEPDKVRELELLVKLVPESSNVPALKIAALPPKKVPPDHVEFPEIKIL